MTSPASPKVKPPNRYDRPIIAATSTTAGSVESLPCAMPSMVTVAGPVSDWRAMPFTGPKCSEVKYSEVKPMAHPPSRPVMIVSAKKIGALSS